MVTRPRILRRPVARHPAVRKVLLGCGIASSVLYIASDIIGSLRYPGYSWLDQEFSELTAQGAPTRPLMIALVEFPYNLLVLAFAAALWTSAGPKQRPARLAAASLVGYVVFGFIGGMITPMNTREILAAGAASSRNAFHGPMTMVSSIFCAAAIVFGGRLLGTRFRYYSYTTVVLLVVFGALAGLQIPQMGANQPTPWMGLEERINIYAIMLWMALLAVGLLRAEATRPSRQLGRPPETPRTTRGDHGTLPL